MKYFIYGVIINLVAFSCQTPREENDENMQKIDIQGHRGARGEFPENTIPAFIYALNLGVNTLELDLAVSADGQLVVSHEPYFHHEICLKPDGSEIKQGEDIALNIYGMTYEEISQYDCGTRIHPRFPEQQKLAIAKPLLVDVFAAVEAEIAMNNLPKVKYNIELKSMTGYDTIYHPRPAEFSDIVYSTINNVVDWDRVIIQSFDFRVLQYFHSTYPHVKLACLVENDKSWEDNVALLGFTPAIYSPYFKRLDSALVKTIQSAGMQVIPWTANESEDIQRLIYWQVDGIITDYPARALSLVNDKSF